MPSVYHIMSEYQSALEYQSTTALTECESSRLLYGLDINNPATIPIRRALFLDYQWILPKICSSSMKIYRTIPNAPVDSYYSRMEVGYLVRCLTKLVESQSMKSYLRLSYCQLVSFIFYHNLDEEPGSNMSFFISFMNELRATFNTICMEDRRILRVNTIAQPSKNLMLSLGEDSCFLVNWSVIEAVKYCVNQKFLSDISTNESIFSLLQKEVTRKIYLHQRVHKLVLLKFFDVMNRILFDKTSETSTGKYTSSLSSGLIKFIQAKDAVIKSWIAKNQLNVAKLSLIVGDFAECSRSASLKLQQDLALRYQRIFHTGRQSKYVETITPLDPKTWSMNIHILVLSAKHLNDLPMLKGIESLVGVSLEYPALKAIVLNLEGRYEDTYNLLIGQANLDDQNIIQFLECCVELDLLEDNKHMIDKLRSDKLKYLYRAYLDSKSILNDEMPVEKLKEVSNWLQAWSLDVHEPETISDIQSYMTYLDLVIPTCANIIQQIPVEERNEHVDSIEQLLSQQFISDCLFPPSLFNNKMKIYSLILDMVRDETLSLEDLIRPHADDLHWNHQLYRSISDLNITHKLKDIESIHLIHLKALKYNRKKGNIQYTTRIAKHLEQHVKSSDELRLRKSLTLIERRPSSLLELAKDIPASDLCITTRSEFAIEILNSLLKLPETQESDILELSRALEKSFDGIEDSGEFEILQEVMSLSNLSLKIKTLSLFSKQYEIQFENNKKILNSYFKTNLVLLENLSQSTEMKHKSLALKTAVLLLKLIVSNYSELSSENYDRFSSSDFIEQTLDVWLNIRTNIINLILYDEQLPSKWRDAMTKTIEEIVRRHPDLLIYSIIANRLDLQSELLSIADRTSVSSETLLSCTDNGNNQPATDSKPDAVIRKLSVWNAFRESLKQSDRFANQWDEVLDTTENFVREMRRISFLCGENLKILTMRIPRRLNNFVDYLSKICDKETGIVGEISATECESKLKSLCEQSIKSISSLTYCKDVNRQTKYDVWFCSTFAKQLSELEYRINLLYKKRSKIIEKDIRKLVSSITELFAVCQATLNQYNRDNRNTLFMELISPTLSRLQPSYIPMPDHCSEPISVHRPSVTIHKISQTVDLITSKTSPKRLNIIGSDGLKRSFLLKAHEDTRLDQLIVNFYSIINRLLLSDKEDRGRHRIRSYSVTPLSSRSGLIEWVEAPAIFSHYRNWLDGPNGKSVVEALYAETCSSLCSSENKCHHCQPPKKRQSIDIFYQLLWSKTKSSTHSLAETRPSSGNSIKFRNTFDLSTFQSVVDQLSNAIPKEIISNQLWFKSNNSYLYWLKTQKFITSCATISMVGYVIGLGDRHLDNILLDHETGEVIHIDQNICFELGQKLSIPEKVPFRLTPNLVHAFGFAGLEGGFTVSSRRVLNLLKKHKSTILHLLDPINLNFMIKSNLEGAKIESKETINTAANLFESKQDLVPIPQDNNAFAFEMCSQECLDLDVKKDVDNLIILQPESKNMLPAASPEVRPARVQPIYSNDLQNNIKTPTKIKTETALDIHNRIKDKLCGTDESIRHYKSKKINLDVTYSDAIPNSQSTSANDEHVPDLIKLNDAQTTDDQVEALIFEAMSMKNKAAMFEGWTAWM